MSDFLSYKHYNGTVEYSKEDSCLFGKVIGIKSLLSYEGNSVQELEADFQSAVDGYLADCRERKIVPEQPYKGTFNIRMSASKLNLSITAGLRQIKIFILKNITM